jgi:hypothetical protein
MTSNLEIIDYGKYLAECIDVDPQNCENFNSCMKGYAVIIPAQKLVFNAGEFGSRAFIKYPKRKIWGQKIHTHKKAEIVVQVLNKIGLGKYLKLKNRKERISAFANVLSD